MLFSSTHLPKKSERKPQMTERNTYLLLLAEQEHWENPQTLLA